MSKQVTRSVAKEANERLWSLLGEELPPIEGGRPRDPYMEQGCHPDVVARVWDELGATLPRDCCAQAKGRPVLAHPDTDRIIALALGTAYALWLTPADFETSAAETVTVWAGGRTTDLSDTAGPGWIWGRWYEDEPRWLLSAYAAADRR